MRITSANAAALAAAPAAAQRSSSGSFALNEGDGARKTATPALRSVGGIEALIALQGVEDPTERKKRAVTRGRTALDVLDSLKVGLLGGTFEPTTLGHLKAASTGLLQDSGDPVLDSVLGEIRLRVEVELAKAGIR